MTSLTWGQVLAWRMRRQFLETPATAAVPEIAARLAGVQAQVASAAELTVAVRQAVPDRAAVGRALWDERSVIKTWAMRGTLHLLPAPTAGAYLSLMGSLRTWEKPAWQKASGTTPAEVAALVEAAAEALDGRVLTREELIAEVVQRTGSGHLEEMLRSGWGSLLKPVAWQGELCHGPSQGNRVTFTRPSSWAPAWSGVPEPEAAAPVVIRAYLGAHGPATMTAFDAWLMRGITPKKMLRQWFADMGDELAAVDVEGEPAYALAEHVDELATQRPSRTVRLLAGFDQYVLGAGTNAAQVIAPERRADVSRTAGWIAPVVLAGGRVVGVWAAKNGVAEIDVQLFEAVPKRALAAEVKRVTGLLR